MRRVASGLLVAGAVTALLSCAQERGGTARPGAGQARGVLVSAPAGAATARAGSRPPPAGAPRPAADFTAGPTVAREGGRVRITFTMAAPTDVTVAVVAPDGRVVRHLASGLLGPNAPAPFEKGALSQTLLWDGRDDAGRPVPAGCKVRVGAGLGVRFDRLIEWEPPSVYSRGIAGMAFGPDGTLYVLQGHMFVKNIRRAELLAFGRDGKYLRTLVPFRADLPAERLPEVELLEAPDGTREPVSESPNFLPGLRWVRRQTMLVRGERILMVSGRAARPLGSSERARRHLLSLGLDGAIAGSRYFGPALPGHTARTPATYLAASADGRTVYVAGLRGERKTFQPHHVVYRARWEDAEVRPFLGVYNEPGADAKHLDDPRGLALDGEGRLWVCDYGNDRIQVFTQEGRLLKSLPVRGPEQVAVHPRTGAAYVLSVKARTTSETLNVRYEDYHRKALVKLAGLADWRRVASLDLPERKLHLHDAGPILCLEASGREPVLLVSCVGRQLPGDYLWRVADRGGELVRVQTRIPRYRWPWGQWNGAVAVDRAREELYLAGAAVPAVLRVDGRTGRATRLERLTAEFQGTGRLPTDDAQVTGMALDAEGRLYLRLVKGTESRVRRYDRAEKRFPFTAAEDGEIRARMPGRGFHPSTLAVGRGGEVYVLRGVKPEGPSPVERTVLDVYGADGALKRKEFMPRLSGAAWGPRLGPKGELYFTEALRPVGTKRDEKERGSVLFSPPENSGARASETRGSLVRLSGGRPRIRFAEGDEVARAAWEVRHATPSYPPKLMHAPVALEGADWVHYGVSPVPFDRCVCPGTAFDVDGFGRAAVPEAERFRVKVLDAAGNLVLVFGAYGNRDSRGPASAVPVPELPLYGPLATAFSDEAVYVYDALNGRVVRARLAHAREAELAVP